MSGIVRASSMNTVFLVGLTAPRENPALDCSEPVVCGGQLAVRVRIMDFLQKTWATLNEAANCISALRRIARQEQYRRNALEIITRCKESRGEDPIKEFDPRIQAIFAKRGGTSQKWDRAFKFSDKDRRPKNRIVR